MSRRDDASEIRSSCWSAALLTMGFLVGSQPALAQFGQGGSQTGTGQNGSGQSGQGQTGQGQTGQGQTGQGQSGTGGGGLDTSGVMSGSTGQPDFLQFGESIDTTGGTGFVGRGNVANTFIGGTVQPGQGAASGAFGGPGGGGAFGGNQFSQFGRGQGQFQQGTGQTGPSRSERVRPRHRIAFGYAPQQHTVISTTLQSRLTNLPARWNGVDVTMDAAGTATLRGTAATDYDAKVAAALARLEPGVRKVDNQLTVAESGEPASP